MRAYFTKRAFLGKRLPESFGFQRIECGRIANAMIEIDPGRFLHLFFFVDGTGNFLTEGFNGTNATKPRPLFPSCGMSGMSPNTPRCIRSPAVHGKQFPAAATITGQSAVAQLVQLCFGVCALRMIIPIVCDLPE